MKKHKVVIFDWGGVLADNSGMTTTSKEFYTEIARDLGVFVYSDVFKERLEEFLYDTHDSILVSNKEFVTDAFVRWVLSVFMLPETPEFIADFKKSFIINSFRMKANKELVAFVHTLVGKCKIGLLSNCCELEKAVQDCHVMRSKFDYIWLSCDVNDMKPNVGIYQRVATTLNYLDDYEILFIDDCEDNIAGLDKIGWKTFLHTGDNKVTINAIQRFLKE